MFESDNLYYVARPFKKTSGHLLPERKQKLQYFTLEPISEDAREVLLDKINILIEAKLDSVESREAFFNTAGFLAGAIQVWLSMAKPVEGNEAKE